MKSFLLLVSINQVAMGFCPLAFALYLSSRNCSWNPDLSPISYGQGRRPLPHIYHNHNCSHLLRQSLLSVERQTLLPYTYSMVYWDRSLSLFLSLPLTFPPLPITHINSITKSCYHFFPNAPHKSAIFTAHYRPFLQTRTMCMYYCSSNSFLMVICTPIHLGQHCQNHLPKTHF